MNAHRPAAEGVETPARGTRRSVLRVSTVGRDFTELIHIARSAEESGVRALLLDDAGDGGSDPVVVACALARKTRTIELVAAVNTARQHPFGIARRLSGLVQVSGGRAGWAPQDSNRYRLLEAVTIARALWYSWPPEAVVADKAAGVWVETTLVSSIHFDGVHYSVHAPLDLPRSLTGEPHLYLPAELRGSLAAPATYLDEVRVDRYEDSPTGYPQIEKAL
ncbi:LLM class flavin-dependent oxidoreductase [Mycolicibacterium goodii]|uniref:LLM class flavin-dependent oxidoreductase n=1 Tax=Mycolicibacterium goodii TaxID=134601 RepID=A0ABS6HQ91_MYCGD|nr:LLM class flavin-dependent oxidoreductase [Mycolicibacterium goodii]MBU8836499.1 LLM class flavin-dependent oxidoreductase [Mycolicibacterium goodii]